MSRICGYVIVLAVAVAAHAEDTVKISGYGGPFSHLVRQGVWIQRSITVTNAGQRPRKITVLVPTDVAGGGRREYRRSVTVPPGAARRVDLVAQTGKLEVVQKVRNRTLSQMFYVLRDGDVELARAFGLVDVAPPGATVMGSVGIPGEDHDASAYMDRLAGRELGDVVSAVAGAVPPDRWQGYDMVAVLRLEEDVRNLRPSQREAILDWVRRGGLLMLTGGERVTETLEGPLAAAAGVCATGIHRVGQLRVVDLADGKAMPPVELGWPMPMLELCPAGAEVLCEANGLPLLTRKPLGSGWVLTLAVPVGALEDSRLHRVWWRVAQTRQARSPVDDTRFLRPARDTLRRIAGRRGPTRNVVAAVLIVPVVAIVAAGAWLMRRRRGEWGWLVLIPLAAGIGVVLYAVSLARRDPERISHIGLISGVDDDVARVQQVFQYYSGPQQRRLTFRAGTDRGVVREFTTGSSTPKDDTVETAELMSLPDLDVEVDNARAVYVDAMKATPGITGSLTFGPDGLTGTLSNRLGLDVSQAVIYSGRRTYRLRCVAQDAPPGVLPNGGNTPVAVAPSDFLARVRFAEEAAPKARPKRPRKPRRPPTTTPATRPAAWRPKRKWAVGEFTGSLHNNTTDRLRNDLVGQLAAVPGIATQADTRPVLIGYADGTLIQRLGSLQVARQGWSVVVWPIHLAPPADGQAVLVPAGFVDVSFTHVGAPVWDGMNQRFNPTFRPTEILVHARPPRVIGQLEAAEAILRISMDATGYRLVVSGMAPRGRRKIPLKTFDNPGVIELTAPLADRFRTADGRYVFSLDVQRIDAPARDDMMRWAFEDIEVALKGTCRAAGQ